jgi:hypothetical protein
MNRATIGKYTVEAFNDVYSVNSTDNNNKYDSIYLEGTEDCYSTLIGIKIYRNDSHFKSAIIGAQGGGTTIHETSHIIKSDRIVVCCSDTVFCLSIPDLELLWKTKSDAATCFQVFKYKDDYIVHGELEITRLGNDGKILWQQGGGDIFVTLNSSQEEFVIMPDYILATDWENRKYKFDFDGNEFL